MLFGGNFDTLFTVDNRHELHRSNDYVTLGRFLFIEEADSRKVFGVAAIIWLSDCSTESPPAMRDRHVSNFYAAVCR